MAALDTIRLRISFDLPPPGMPMSSRYAILVKLDACTTVSDIEQTIIRKFGFSKGASLTLALDNFVVLPVENAHVFKNDDHITVSLLDDSSRTKQRKRKLCPKTENVASKAVKIEKQVKCSLNGDRAHFNRKAKDDTKKAKTSVKPAKSQTSSTESDSSEDEASIAAYSRHSRQPTTAGKPCATKHNDLTKKSRQKSTLSKANTTVASLGAKENRAVKKSPFQAVKPLKQKNALIKKPAQSVHHTTFDSTSDSSSSSGESELVTEQPTPRQTETEGKASSAAAANPPDFKPSPGLQNWIKTAEVRDKSPNKGKRKRLCTNISGSQNVHDPGMSTNKSVVIQNPPLSNGLYHKPSDENCKNAPPSKPVRNYSELKTIGWPPQVGDTIGYKLLEMTENYTPEISEFKEGSVTRVFSASESPTGVNAVAMKTLWPPECRGKRSGRFEMDLEDDIVDDNTEQVIEWVSLIDPRFIARAGT